MSYTIHATALLPINLTKLERKKLFQRQPWKHWTNGLSSSEKVDMRRFFNRSTVDIFRPLEDGRWCLDLSCSLLADLALNYSDEIIAELTGVQLVDFGNIHFLYLSVSTTPASKSDIFPLQRQLFSFFQKSHSAELPKWSQGDNAQPLSKWIEQLIGRDIGHSEDNMEDWLGHELPYCLHVETNTSEENQNLTVNLVAGADPAKPSYKLAQLEAAELKNSMLSVWDNWHCLQAYHRLIFVGDPSATALHENLSRHHYYIDLFALAIYQRMQYERFQESLTAANPKTLKNLNLKIRVFRQRYNIAQVSGYPLAQRLYKYVCERLELKALEEKVFNEIDYQHGQQQRANEENYNFMLFSISVLAAIILPLDSLSTLMALPAAERDFDFWLTVAISGLGVLAIMLLPMLWRSYRRSRYDKKEI